MDDREPTREDVCYHEAGHAVFYHHAGINVDFLQVEAEGWASTQWPTQPDPAKAVLLAAGSVASWYAEDRRGGVSRPHMSFDDFMSYAQFEDEEHKQLLAWGAPVDRPPDSVLALEMLRLAADWPDNPWGELEDCYGEMCDTVDRGMEEWWAEIEIVAERVCEYRYISGKGFARLLE